MGCYNAGAMKKTTNLKIENGVSPLAQMTRKHFPGKRFPASVLKPAGRKLKDHGEQAAIEFLQANIDVPYGNFKAPAKCNVVATSRPYSEWPLYKFSSELQKAVFALSKDRLMEIEPSKQSDAENEKFLSAIGVSADPSINVTFVSACISKAVHTYLGMEKKAENKYQKKLSRCRSESELSSVTPENVYNEDGTLSDGWRPGFNANLYGNSNSKLSLFGSVRSHNKVELPVWLSEYREWAKNRSKDSKINEYSASVDRLSIPEGQPGHVPLWQRDSSKRTKPGGGEIKEGVRRHRWYSNRNNANRRNKVDQATRLAASAMEMVLAIAFFGEDWVLFDIRGLLRNARYRKLVNKNTTYGDLMELFTADPVLDTKRGIITASYKDTTLKIVQQTIVGEKKSKSKILEEVQKNGPVAVVSIDLGVNEPVSYRVSRVDVAGGNAIVAELAAEGFMSNELKKEISSYREKSDELNGDLREKAVLSLSDEMQAEIRRVDATNASDSKNRICEMLSLDPESVDWSKMTTQTRFIFNKHVENGGDPNVLLFTPTEDKKNKGKKSKNKKGEYGDRVPHSDSGIARNIAREKLSMETCEALNKAKRELQQEDPRYGKLSKRKQEFARRVVNGVVVRAQEVTGCDNVVLVVEKLNVSNKMFSGSGKRAPGWDNFFVHKKENRWFIQALHKAFTDKAAHKGIPVIEIKPSYTSQTCPACEHCDKDNRDGVHFCCTRCGFTGHADLNVACFNIEKVALTGEAMSGPGSATAHKKTRKPKKAMVESDKAA
jgi:hypothetical protein